MKNKWVRLAAQLTLLAALLTALWILADMPAFTAESAFRKAERRQLLEESTFLESIFLVNAHYSGKDVMNGSIFVHAGVGKTENALHVTELCKQMPFPLWYNEEETVVIPLDGDVTAEWNPWCAEWQKIGVLVYSPLAFDHGYATICIGEWSFTEEFTATESGLVNVPFPNLGSNLSLDEERQQITCRQYDMRSIGYDKSLKTDDVALKVTLYDEDGGQVAAVTKEYPAFTE